MNGSNLVEVYDSQSDRYRHAFQVFLDHTDQKARAKVWLDSLVQTLPTKGVFIDVGAGNFEITAWFIDRFQHTIGIEPNAFLCDEFLRRCPTAEVIPQTILEARPEVLGDLVLCSHVFYYIHRSEWVRHLQKLVSWLSPVGVLVVVWQNHQTDCMEMLDHFFGERFDLLALAKEFQATTGGRYQVNIETVPAYVTSEDFEAAYMIAEFILNDLPIRHAPSRTALDEYVREHFAEPNGGFRFSCHQDFLQIRPSA